MKADLDKDMLIFSSGLEVYAHRCVVGLSEDMESVSPTYGYDGEFPLSRMSKNEKIELANYMIELWQEYKTGVENDR